MRGVPVAESSGPESQPKSSLSKSDGISVHSIHVFCIRILSAQAPVHQESLKFLNLPISTKLVHSSATAVSATLEDIVRTIDVEIRM